MIVFVYVQVKFKVGFFYIVYIVNLVKCISEEEVCKIDLGLIYLKLKLGDVVGGGGEVDFLLLFFKYYYILNGLYCYFEFIQKKILWLI